MSLIFVIVVQYSIHYRMCL